MAVHRRRKLRVRKPPRAPRGTYRGLTGADDDLGQAAKVIADAAKDNAASWSASIPGSVSVESDGKTAVVYSDAPAAYPNEVQGVRHPTFGHRPHVTNKYRPFLKPAADEKASAAMDRYAQKLDRMLKKAGFG